MASSRQKVRGGAAPWGMLGEEPVLLPDVTGSLPPVSTCARGSRVLQGRGLARHGCLPSTTTYLRECCLCDSRGFFALFFLLVLDFFPSCTPSIHCLWSRPGERRLFRPFVPGPTQPGIRLRPLWKVYALWEISSAGCRGYGRPSVLAGLGKQNRPSPWVRTPVS